MSKILSVALAAVVGIAACPPALSAPKDPAKPIAALTEILSDPQAILRVIPALPDSITRVDPTAVRLFMYNERKREETEALATVVENRLSEELLRLHRFKVIEAREAKTLRVESSSTNFQLSNTIESLARMRAIGQSVGADAILMYAPQIQDRMVLVNAKLVRVGDGEILWTERFAYNFDLQRAEREAQAQAEEASKLEAERRRVSLERRTRDNGLYAYTGMTGYAMRRRSAAAGTSDEVSPAGLSVGFMGLRNMGFAENAAFGVDLQIDQMGSVNPKLSLPMVTLSPLFLLRLDPLFVKGENDGVFNLYFGPGETFIFQAPQLSYQFTGKAGLMVRFTPDMFLNLGAVYVPQQEVGFQAVPGLDGTVKDFGGLTYQVTFGLAFK
ncbi:MAG TPA: FlgO family outer membrane protein [Pantanalinema sp.]